MVRTLFALWQLDPGFNPRAVMTFSIAPQPSLIHESPASIRAFLRRVHESLAESPGVEAASLSVASSLIPSNYDWHIWFAGRPKPAHSGDLQMSLIYVVEPDYLKTFQIHLKHGRFFKTEDNEDAPAVAVIDESLASKYFKGQDPVGQYLDLDNDPTQRKRRPEPRIVGVVGHVNQWGLEQPQALTARGDLYAAQPDAGTRRQQYGQGVQVFVRGRRGRMPVWVTATTAPIGES